MRDGEGRWFQQQAYDRQFLDTATRGRHELRYLDCRLTIATTALVKGSSAARARAAAYADSGELPGAYGPLRNEPHSQWG